MTAVAERRRVRFLACTQVRNTCLRRRIRHRGKLAALMRTVAEWLPRGLATGAPVIGLACFQIYCQRPGRNIGTLHGFSLLASRAMSMRTLVSWYCRELRSQKKCTADARSP